MPLKRVVMFEKMTMNVCNTLKKVPRSNGMKRYQTDSDFSKTLQV